MIKIQCHDFHNNCAAVVHRLLFSKHYTCAACVVIRLLFSHSLLLGKADSALLRKSVYFSFMPFCTNLMFLFMSKCIDLAAIRSVL